MSNVLRLRKFNAAISQLFLDWIITWIIRCSPLDLIWFTKNQEYFWKETSWKLLTFSHIFRSPVSKNVTMGTDIFLRYQKAVEAFEKMDVLVWNLDNITEDYQWLEGFNRKCLKNIFNINWELPNENIVFLERYESRTIAKIIIRKMMRWVRYIVRLKRYSLSYQHVQDLEELNVNGAKWRNSIIRDDTDLSLLKTNVLFEWVLTLTCRRICYLLNVVYVVNGKLCESSECLH